MVEHKPKLYLAISSRDGIYNDRIQRIAQSAGWQVIFPSDGIHRRGGGDILVKESLNCQEGLVVWSQNSVSSRFLRRVARRLAVQRGGISVVFGGVSPPENTRLAKSLTATDSNEFWVEFEDFLRNEAQRDFELDEESDELLNFKELSKNNLHQDLNTTRNRSSHKESRKRKMRSSKKKQKLHNTVFAWFVILVLAASLYITNQIFSDKLHKMALRESSRGYPELFEGAKRVGGGDAPGFIIQGLDGEDK